MTWSTKTTLTGLGLALALALIGPSLALSETASTSFRWAVESVPQPTVWSDAGNVLITKAGTSDAQLTTGIAGNAIQQTGNHQYYKFPIGSMNLDKGVIRMHVKHTIPSGPDGNTYRNFFRTTNIGANSITAYTYNNYIFFYIYDASGTWHRAFGQATWSVDVWYLYEFIWDADTGEVTIRRDGVDLFQSFTPSWSSALPSFANQDMFIGHVYPLGAFDEIYIGQKEDNLEPPEGSANYPPEWDAFVEKINTFLPTAYLGINNYYDEFYLLMSNQSSVFNINKKPIYYDPAKFLFEYSELVWPSATVDMKLYSEKSNEILSDYYKNKNPAGYERFPYGLFYMWHNSGEEKWYDGLEALATQQNFTDIPLGNGYPTIGYSRELAYIIEVSIGALKSNINANNTLILIRHAVDLALGHLDQFHTGIFLDQTASHVRQSFMVGITMMALIEYYDRVDRDDRIPPMIKSSIDDLWHQQKIVLGNDTISFWAWADYTNNQWINNENRPYPNHPNLNMMIGPAYAWYALWLKENDPQNISIAKEYMDKSIQIWDGYVAGVYFTRPDELWEFNKYIGNFLKYYRSFYGVTCGIESIGQCVTEQACENNGGNWSGERCQHAPVAVPVSGIKFPEDTEEQTLFYWTCESVPSPSVISDIGGKTIAKTGGNDAVTAAGDVDNAIHYTQTHVSYGFDAGFVPGDKGIIRMHVKHDIPSGPDASRWRVFFKSTNTGVANALYAYQYNNYLYFYLYDSTGTMRRAYGQATWQTGTWYLYEFEWDAANGALIVRRDGNILLQSISTSWLEAVPSFVGQTIKIGDVYPLGAYDEIYVIGFD
ncbi:MAG: hypothetical protein LBD10_12290 [Desulfobulbus sp.]|jgi:hypothetical protein|uniref:hypothetical protein n=1 Tax=Desulfobulbus sp. TaxID=895 RepID=UPI00284888CE|nr:hypothetical protein [Desulfobulbus sp.]MDR2550967.1 hypothetical protein [Desulfobulbus sp.]